ncbi:MAG: hypothetical protein D6702_03260 [Planctomycetota bacterium]|nr:MAG: hypothetical protein D6702_03260 [Planctomycetota bacterium]
MRLPTPRLPLLPLALVWLLALGASCLPKSDAGAGAAPITVAVTVTDAAGAPLPAATARVSWLPAGHGS